MQDETSKQTLLENARLLVKHLEEDNTQAADKVLEELASEREMKLFQEVGQLTRELHNNIASFAIDGNLSNLKEKEIPDAKERLAYVIQMTEDAANKTLNAIDEIEPATESMKQSSIELSEKWEKFMSRNLSVDEFKVMASQITLYLDATCKNSSLVHEKVNEIVLAQGFQDLTGQIISKVITLVQDVEDSLVDLIRIAGMQTDEEKEPQTKAASELEGPAVPGVKVEGAISSQDDVDDLLSSLGF